MSYTHLTSEERYTFSTMRKQGHSIAYIAKALDRHRSTLYRELERNSCNRIDCAYRPSKAQYRALARRSKLRRYSQFSKSDYLLVRSLLRQKWSPEQIAGVLPSLASKTMSHETIYKYIWADKADGGNLWQHLRQSTKQRRKRYKAYDSRGRLANKRHISERPKSVETRKYKGHWEIDTVMGTGSNDCIVTLVERKSGYVLIGKLPNRSTASLNAKTISLIKKAPAAFKTITADNGTEFHQYTAIEKATNTKFFFTNPYHSWERGSNENCNGLIRQYLPKGTSMASLSQQQCNRIAEKLNSRPRKRHNFKTPEKVLYD
ncbi:IS30 family transposase [Teredinibacter turnerae]|uniref:IS30 family transposase n=2 Tax=Teredinibacter turnerae TaxID=2426 RepID=UPI00040AE4E0|nr:IS30 family transposase [Teredinibacter turnerae]